MRDPFVPRVGGVLSADIAVPEHEREVRFYSRVLTTGERPLWREDLINSRGLPVVGLGPRSAEYDHLPLQWMPHIQVADVAASAKRALELGGKELMLDGSGQWAVLLDPNGAAFGIIPVVPADAIPATEGAAESTGHIAGIELTVPDAALARDFYREVVGWSVRDVEAGAPGESHTDFEMLGADGNLAAILRHARGAHSGLPPVWLLQLPVADLAESLRRVRDEGGEVIQANEEVHGDPGRAVIQDPVGACLALMRE
ncbi:MAG: VOC family protein [Planctomycetota bacterium]|jgi:predicted enzyme related to lactoylglutathione lyase